MGDCSEQLDVYLDAAFRHGATEQKILSIFNHAASSTTGRMVRVGEHETLIRDSGGPGVPIVLIHALSMDERMFQQLLPRLVDSGYRVLAYDLCGHGSARGAPVTVSLEQLGADLLALLDALNIPVADVAGASDGGAVAQYVTLAAPTWIRSLFVMASSAQGHPLLASRGSRAEAGEMPALRTEAITRWFAPTTIADNTWCVRYARAQLDKIRIEEWAAAWRAMAKLNCLQRIRDITCPILVLDGAKDLSDSRIHDANSRRGKKRLGMRATTLSWSTAQI
ncbi:hypothetical protein LTR17_018354 [Elasticomyces elasticus]|nr:hypothetical protein LTR17_018354 [Elasticomyces elasticus]